MGFKYDFSGYATKNDLRCSDGRIIRKNAFKDNDGMTVPLVWQHQHDSPTNVLGHALLENRDDGVYVYGIFNNTENAKQAKALVQHGDINGLSIYANKLKQNGHDVLHGSIKEVSLVLAGANPGAYIDQTSIAHADGGEIDDAIIYTDELIQNGGEKVMEHDDVYEEYEENDYDDESGFDDDDEEYDIEDITRIFESLNDDQQAFVYSLLDTVFSDDLEHDDLDEDDDEYEYDEEDLAQIFDSFNDEQQALVFALLDEAFDELDLEHADRDEDDPDETVGDVFNSLTDKQKKVVYYLIGEAMNHAGNLQQSDEGDGTYMKTNVFDSGRETDYILAHADIDGMREDIMTNAKRYGSLRDAAEDVLEHADEYGIKGVSEPAGYSVAIDALFPDATAITKTPEFIKRRSEWVNVFLSKSTHKPFARIKTLYADITEDEARAKGYIKGNKKKDEVFKLLKRVTTPQTIYKKQKFDRDDIVDITDFDIIPWVKSEMRLMLDEEIARAALVGDGRTDTENGDKIKEENVRPILTDDDLFTIKYQIDVVQAAALTDDTAEKVIDGAILSRPKYEGSGRPICFIDDNLLALMLIQKDDIGHRMYKDENEIAAIMGASAIVPCPFMSKLTRTTDKDGSKKADVFAILVNPADYTFGADRGGALSMFDDFDINFNQQIYLMETRLSGALVKPHSAIVIESKPSES